MYKARLRIHKPNSIEPDGEVQIILSDGTTKVHAVLPIANFAYALMGTSGIDCEMEIIQLAKDEKTWSQEKCGTNTPPTSVPSRPSVGNKRKKFS